MQRSQSEGAENADIERELFQLGLSDSPPRARRTLSSQVFPPTLGGNPHHPTEFRPSSGVSRAGIERFHTVAQDAFFERNVSSGAYRTTSDGWMGAGGIRSSSAPAMPFERSLSHPEDALLPSGVGHLRGTSQGTRSLNDIEPGRTRSSSHGSATARGNPRGFFRPLVTTAPSSVRQDPGGVHYPGYVELQDFLTLPRGANEAGDDPDEEAEAEEVERELIASIEAMLRRVHAGIQESYIHYDHPDSVADPPPPQPVGASLRDPPPSPEPPHNQVSPPQPPYNGVRGGPRGAPSHPMQQQVRTQAVAPTSLSVSAHPPPSHALGTSRGVFGPPRLIDPNNASKLSRQLGFIPIQAPSSKKSETPKQQHHHHHHHHHRHQDTQVTLAHHYHHHTHHQRKKSSKALRRIKNVAAIARGSGIKIVKIRRDSFMGFGFSIKGSLEGGFGVYVSRVEESGPAWAAGLRPGDLLLAANNHPVSQMGHTEIIHLLKSSEEISLTVAVTSQLSTPAVVSQSYSWVTPDTRPTSPPAQYNPLLHQHQIATAIVNVAGSDGLGLMIRGGAEYGLGIFITGVDPGSAAEKAGLQVGDQILEVNGENFLSVTHDTAVSVLKYSRLLKMSLRRVAKVPHSCTTYHRRRKSSKSRRPSTEDRMSDGFEATLAMIEEKSKSVLSPGDHSLLQETVTEYAAGKAPVSRLLAVAAQVLNSPDKLSLLTELREVVRPADLAQFDSTVFSQSSVLSIDREEMFGVEGDRGAMTPSEFDDLNKLIRSFHLSMEDSLEENELSFRDKHFSRVERDFSEYVKTPSEDSGVDSNNERVIRRKKKVTQQKERKRIKNVKENESNLLGNFDDDDGVSLIQESNEKLIKTNMKNRKILRKKLPDKFVLSKDDFIDDYQDQSTSPTLRLSPQEDYDVGCEPSPYFEHPLLEELTLPPFSGHSIPEASLQCSYYTHNLPTMTSSYSHRFNLDLPTSQPSHAIHNHAEVTSHSPMYDPTLPEETSHSTLFSPSPSKATTQLRDFDKTSDNLLCHTARDHQRPLLDFGSHRTFSDFRNSVDVKDQMSFSDQRSQMRPSREQQQQMQQQQQQQAPAPHHKGDVRSHSSVMKPVTEVRTYYSRSPRLDMARRSDFKDVQEETETEAEFLDEMMSPTTPRPAEHRQICQNGPTHCQPSKASQSLPTHTCISRSGRRTSIVMSDSRGRFHVIVKKTRANLGIAIEGGADTKHLLPRVINIAVTGAAFEAGGLRVGQLILAVDGTRLEGKPHEEAARLIADAWTDRAKSELEFLVVDRKPSEADLRRNSISLLSQVS